MEVKKAEEILNTINGHFEVNKYYDPKIYGLGVSHMLKDAIKDIPSTVPGSRAFSQPDPDATKTALAQGSPPGTHHPRVLPCDTSKKISHKKIQKIVRILKNNTTPIIPAYIMISPVDPKTHLGAQITLMRLALYSFPDKSLALGVNMGGD